MAQIESAAPPFEMRGISKRFGATVALDGVDLAVAAGTVHALIGENGAGKSTLMKVLSGAVQPDSGRMTLHGLPYRPRHPLDARHAGIAMIYQELSLARHLSVEENIVLGMEPTRWGVIQRAKLREQVAEALSQLGHPEIRPTAPVGRLPIGAQQIVEIARAIALGCRIIVFDEPTSSLSQRDVERLFELIRRLKAQGLAVVYISHFLEEVKQIADQFTVLRDGQVAGRGDIANTTVDEIVRMMIGRQLEDLYARSKRTLGEPVLEVSALSGLAKPDSASLVLRRGEVLGIAGLVGAGRTELLRALFGLDAVRRGTIRLGVYAGPASPARRWAQGAGFLSEDRKVEGLALSMSITDNVSLPRLRAWVRPKTLDQAAWSRIRKLDIRCREARQPVNELSGGNQQKVALARLLSDDVDVLLLDEPTRGIDVGSKAQIYRVIEELASGGKAVLMVSSYLPELMGVCDRIAVMCRGRLSAGKPTESVNEHQLMRELAGSDAA